jgi:hypothetical protein
MMLDGYIDFFMDPSLAECYLQLKEEFDKLIQQKVSYAVILSCGILETFTRHVHC